MAVQTMFEDPSFTFINSNGGGRERSGLRGIASTKETLKMGGGGGGVQ